jgi:hypothetical protein
LHYLLQFHWFGFGLLVDNAAKAVRAFGITVAVIVRICWEFAYKPLELRGRTALLKFRCNVPVRHLLLLDPNT